MCSPVAYCSTVLCFVCLFLFVLNLGICELALTDLLLYIQMHSCGHVEDEECKDNDSAVVHTKSIWGENHCSLMVLFFHMMKEVLKNM